MSTYTGNTISDLSITTPLETDVGADTDDAIRQIKRFITQADSGCLVDLVYPVGSVYFSFNTTDLNVDNPSVKIQTDWNLSSPFGTWYKLEEVTLVGHKSGSTEFGTVTAPAASGEAPDVGTKTHTLVENELPAHTHTETRWQIASTLGVNSGGLSISSDPGVESDNTGSTGGDQPHNNIQPSRTVYMWVRAA